MTTEIRYNSWNGLQIGVISFRIADDLHALLDGFVVLSCRVKPNQKITNIVIPIVAATCKYTAEENSMT